MADFNSTAVNALFAALVSKARAIGAFKVLITHEPRVAPASLPALALWWAKISPFPGASGLASVSGVVTFTARVYGSKMLETTAAADDIDKLLLARTGQLINVLSGGFTLGGTVRNIDLQGGSGQQLEAATGFITHEGVVYRVAQVTIPVVINDLWSEVA